MKMMIKRIHLVLVDHLKRIADQVLGTFENLKVRLIPKRQIYGQLLWQNGRYAVRIQPTAKI